MICPRCNSNQIPNNETPGAYPGALSRVDNKTEICSDCGTDEALENYYNKSLIQIKDWPITNDLFKHLEPTFTSEGNSF